MIISGVDYVSLDLSKDLLGRGYKGISEIVIAGTENKYYFLLRSELGDDKILCENVYRSSHMYEILPSQFRKDGKLYVLTPTYEENTPTDYVGYKERDGRDVIYKKEGLSADRLARLVLTLITEGIIKP